VIVRFTVGLICQRSSYRSSELSLRPRAGTLSLLYNQSDSNGCMGEFCILLFELLKTEC